MVTLGHMKHGLPTLIFLVAALPASGQPLSLQPGDHICIIGNTLAERLQHLNSFETSIHARFPKHQLVIRNLGFSGDELTTRLRSAGFGSPDDWLRRCRADVVLAFFGYNEAWQDEAGLPKFRRDLAEFIRQTRGQNYNGKSPPSVVLFSPIAFELRNDRRWIDAVAMNRRLRLYADAMAEVAKAQQVQFVDLFTVSSDLYAKLGHQQPFTINGVHLTKSGEANIFAAVADHVFAGADTARQLDGDAIARLNRAIGEKNFHWFQRYRTTDGYSIFGGRADLKFVNDQTNREVAQREMEILDVMTANRDQVVWEAAQGRSVRPDDSNLPPLIPVVTNKPGKGPNGEHVFLSGNDSLRHMKVGQGLKVELFASEEQFPELAKPVQMTWDARGRLWVAVWPSYPHWTPTEAMNDKILVFEDTKGAGRADRMTVFADGLHNPTGFEIYDGGVIVAQAPDLMFLKDNDGDGKADERQRILHGLDSADTHHTANSFVFDPGGALYFQEGTFHHTQVETPWGPPVRNINAGVFRYEPRRHKFEVYAPFGFANPHGHAFDRWGQDIVIDGTGSQPYHAALISGRLPFPAKHPAPPQVYQQRTRPCPGIEYLSSRHFPEEFQGNLLVANVIGFQGIQRYRISDDGASFRGEELEPILSSDDPSFRPSDLKIGPDGALYFIDWHNPIIGHMQHNLRDPSRDRKHGRIYRITCENRPLVPRPAIAGQPVESLLELLKLPEDRARSRVRAELGARPAIAVIPAVENWIRQLDPSDPEHDHLRLEALWVTQWHDAPNAEQLHLLLVSKDARVRAAAARVLCNERDRYPESLARFRTLACDSHPRVRLEAARAASYFDVPEALEIVALVNEQPTDKYLDYVVRESMRTLLPIWRKQLSAGKPIQPQSDVGRQFLWHTMPVEQLFQLERSGDICRAILARPGVTDEQKQDALSDLARRQQESEVQALVGVLKWLDQQKTIQDESAIVDLVRMARRCAAGDLKATTDSWAQMASEARTAAIRELGFAALINGNGSVQLAWELAQRVQRMVDLLAAVPMIGDSQVKAELYPKVAELMDAASGNATAAATRRAAMVAITSFRGKEGDAFDRLARLMSDPAVRPDAIRALQRLPASSWPADRAGPVAHQLISIVRAMPDKDRAAPAARDAMELADSLASFLPTDHAKSMREELSRLGVRVVRIGTVPERMTFDREVIALRAGQPVELVLENTDLMPHNFVIVEPGSLERIGQEAEATATNPEAGGPQYVPRSKSVLLASRLLQPRQSQRLTFTAPRQPGVYPYVCTYPGHWRTMNGAIYVVDDLEQYQANPEAYLAAHPLPVQDALLKSRRPKTEWKYDDLAEAVAAMSHGRSYLQGKQLFHVANCTACHKMEGIGQEYGPDLTRFDAKWKPIDLWRESIEPSARINDKYQSYVVGLANGQTVTGLILGETADALTLVENPVAGTPPRVIKKDDIESRVKSAHSLMPKGLLDKLSRDEILDLIAYVYSRGDRRHEVFREQSSQGHRHQPRQ